MHNDNSRAHQRGYFWLMGCALASYGFFGSLGFLFVFLLVVSILVFDWRNIFNQKPQREILLLYTSLSFVFFWLLVRSIPTTSWEDLKFAASPILPIAIVGLLIILSSQVGFILKRTTIANMAMVGILLIYIVYAMIQLLPEGHEVRDAGMPWGARLTLFSGNPIPFSMIAAGLSLMTLLGWHSRTMVNKIVTLIVASLGVYAATIWADSRGATLGLALVSPAVFYNLTRSYKYTVGYCMVAIISIILAIILIQNGSIQSRILDRITKGVETVFIDQILDNSDNIRTNMWMGSWSAILEQPLTGYGISKRYLAITSYMPESLRGLEFTHPHNDILGSGVAGGVLGLIAAIISLTSGALYATFTKADTEQVCYGLGLTGLIVVIASTNTIYFNDAASSFYAFAIAILIVMEKRTKVE